MPQKKKKLVQLATQNMSALPQDNHHTSACSRSALGILPISLKKKKIRERELYSKVYI